MTIQDFLLFFCHFACFCDCFQILCHHRKWLHWPSFQLAKPTDCCFIGSITAEMKTSDSLDCSNATLRNRVSDIGNCLSAPLTPADQINFRSAFIAAYRLCIVSSGLWIVVFFCTVWTHWKLFHASPFTVIRKRIQDCKSRSAAGTVNKRMQISPVLRIKHLLLTFLTNCNIRRDKDLTLCLFTFDNVKLCITLRIFYVFHIYLQDCRPFWWTIPDI